MGKRGKFVQKGQGTKVPCPFLSVNKIAVQLDAKVLGDRKQIFVGDGLQHLAAAAAHHEIVDLCRLLNGVHEAKGDVKVGT